VSAEACSARDTLTVADSDDRPVQIVSHYHFFETNPALSSSARRRSPAVKRLKGFAAT